MNKIIIAGISASLFLASASGCKKKEKADPVQAVPVTVAKAVKKAMPVSISATGSVEAIHTVTIIAQVDGQLKSVKFKEGQMVSKGDILMIIDPAPYQEKLRQAEAALAKDMDQLKFAKAEAERYRILLASGAVSESDFEQYQTNYETAGADVASDKAQVEQAKINLGYTQIFSPVTGKTGVYLVNEGAIVTKNQTQLVIINQISPTYVKFSVPEKYLPDIKKFMAAGPLKVGAAPQGADRAAVYGTLTFVDNSVDIATGMIMLKATFANKDSALWPGQFVNASLTLDTQKDAVVAPATALQSGQSGQYVFVVKADNTVEMRPVTAERNIGDEMVIAKGLNGDETLVTDGQLKLFSGAPVSIKDAAAAQN